MEEGERSIRRCPFSLKAPSCDSYTTLPLTNQTKTWLYDKWVIEPHKAARDTEEYSLLVGWLVGPGGAFPAEMQCDVTTEIFGSN